MTFRFLIWWNNFFGFASTVGSYTIAVSGGTRRVHGGCRFCTRWLPLSWIAEVDTKLTAHVNLILAFAFDIFELPEISADLLDFLGLQLVGHVELCVGFLGLALI